MHAEVWETEKFQFTIVYLHTDIWQIIVVVAVGFFFLLRQVTTPLSLDLITVLLNLLASLVTSEIYNIVNAQKIQVEKWLNNILFGANIFDELYIKRPKSNKENNTLSLILTRMAA